MTGGGNCYWLCPAQESAGLVIGMFQQEGRAINITPVGAASPRHAARPPAKLQGRRTTRDVEHESHLPD